MDKPVVFISYSHKDEQWKDLLRPHLKMLGDDRIAIWDDRMIDPGGEWFVEMQRVMARATVSVCLISADYLASDFCVKEEIPFLLERRRSDRMTIIPILLRPCVWKAVPWLKELQMLPRDGKSVSKDFKDNADEVFAEVAEKIVEIVDNLSYQPPTPPQPVWSPPEKLDITRLPVTGSELFGRQKELQMLDEAWESTQTNVISFVAWGGVGKSTLINKWLERMAAENYRGARRVFAWSFYSQGTSERATSADLFINAAMEWFGDENPTAGSPWDKGERLARLARERKTLLILDGMEPLQSSFAHERGKIKDPALATLVEELARENNGLCVITTREIIAELKQFEGAFVVSPSDGGLGDETNRRKSELRKRNAARQINLETLSPEAGRALLRVGSVRGSDEELERATEDFGRHALALNLLAVYLRDIPGHYISAAAKIPDLDIPEEEGKHPRRLIAAFEKKFGEGPEVEALRLLGLFDRPADGPSIAALRNAPAIAGLTDHIHESFEADWSRAVQRLRKYKLIAEERHHAPDELDAHPLVREHFGKQLRERLPDAWREANNRLYEHLKRTAKEFPDTIGQLSPLFAAVAHGCAAGRHHEAFEDVYLRRIRRGDQAFSTKQLGAFAADLGALANFFDHLWWKPVSTISEAHKMFLLNATGFRLRALGRLRDATKSLQVGLEYCILRRDWKNAAIASSNYAGVCLVIGDLPQALSFAQQSVAYADQYGAEFHRIGKRARLAEALHQTGHTKEAEAAMIEAEEIQDAWRPSRPILYAVSGYQHCDLLLDQGKYQEVVTRSIQTLEWLKRDGSLIAIALSNLALGRAFLVQSQREGSDNYSEATDFLKQAMDGLRHAGQLDSLPLGLLARAELYRLKCDYLHAQSDLAEAHRIAERGEMGLHLCDCHLEWARLYLAQGNPSLAREHWATAKEMVERMGYHRRDREVEEIARELGETA